MPRVFRQLQSIMGNSNHSERKLSTASHGDQQIGEPSVCPKCGIHFSPNTTYNTLDLHVELCLANPHITQPQQTQQQSQSSRIEPERVPLMFQKVPINQEMTKFKWQRVPVVRVDLNRLRGMPAYQLSKISFQEKLALFRNELEKYRIPWQKGADTLKVEKDNILMTSLQSIYKVNIHKEIKIQFAGDKVNDAGGLLREWVHLAVKELFNPEVAIFEAANTQDTMYKIRSDQELDVEFAESLLQLFGIIVGKAIFERIPLDCYLDSTILRHMTGRDITLSDISGYDKELYKNWVYLMTTEIQPFGQYFSVLNQKADKTLVSIELIPNGDNIEVNEENKRLFVDRMIRYHCTQSIEGRVMAFKRGVHKVVPEQLLAIFEPYEMEMILNGLPFVSVADWKNNTDYKGAYYKNHQVVTWFWDFLDTLSQQQLARLLQFCTGSTRIPVYGFSKLQSNRGNYTHFLIESVVYNKINPYPKAHTCFNRLQLPMYPTEQLLRTHVKALANTDLGGVYGLD